jgi:hypothetical protein
MGNNLISRIGQQWMRQLRRNSSFLSFIPIALVAMLAGCAGSSVKFNPSFAVTTEEARRAIEQMRADRKPLARPVVVVGGFLDPNLATPWYGRFFGGISRDAKIITVSVGLCGSFDECRRMIVDAVDRAWPSDDPRWTTEVDVVGLSLGGLAARYAAGERDDAGDDAEMNRTGNRRLKIARLFTISSPHGGAKLAQRVALTQFHRDMRPGSPFLQSLAMQDAGAGYELYAYVHLGDQTVGEEYAAPPGTTAWWLPNPPLMPGHLAALMDDRILADIGRRLRDETPFTTFPPEPLPAAQAIPEALASHPGQGRVDDIPADDSEGFGG